MCAEFTIPVSHARRFWRISDRLLPSEHPGKEHVYKEVKYEGLSLM